MPGTEAPDAPHREFCISAQREAIPVYPVTDCLTNLAVCFKSAGRCVGSRHALVRQTPYAALCLRERFK